MTDEAASSLPDSVAKLAQDWFRRVRESQHMHYDCSNFFSRLNYMLGVPTMVLTTIVGTAVFASLEKDPSGTARLVVGLISILAAVLAGLHTFLGFAERAEKHRQIAAKYGGVRRRLESLKTFPSREGSLEREFAELKKEIDALAEVSPEVPEFMRRRLQERLRKYPHDRILSCHLTMLRGKLSNPVLERPQELSGMDMLKIFGVYNTCVNCLDIDSAEKPPVRENSG